MFSDISQRPYQVFPEIQTFLEQVERQGDDLDQLSRDCISKVRQAREERAQRFLFHIPVETVRNITVPNDTHSIPARLYVPYEKQLARGGKLPIIIFFHGGGWTLGSSSVYDSVTRALARLIPALVLSVDYRLAPENPFPAAVHDADAVLRWVIRYADDLGGDLRRIVVSGDSAGGTLAICCAMHARGNGGPPLALQLLFYPSTNISSNAYRSYHEYGQGFLLTNNAIQKFRNFYLPNLGDWKHPDASPVLSGDLRGMPAALIVAAGCDPLRSEGKEYAGKLRENGVETVYRLFPHLIHAFLNLYNFDPACSPYVEEVLGYVAGAVRNRLMVHLP